jgi:hypothetical protein
LTEVELLSALDVMRFYPRAGLRDRCKHQIECAPPVYGREFLIDRNRLETCSDGVIVIIITMIVLELKEPHCDSLETLLPLGPVLLSYILSFGYVGITGTSFGIAVTPF